MRRFWARKKFAFLPHITYNEEIIWLRSYYIIEAKKHDNSINEVASFKDINQYKIWRRDLFNNSIKKMIIRLRNEKITFKR